MNVLELVIAAVCAAMGVRSIVVWLRRPVALETKRHIVLYAVFITARAGMWFSVGGLFLIFGTRGTIGRAFSDDVAPYRFLALIPIALAAVSFGASALLAIGDDEKGSDEERD